MRALPGYFDPNFFQIRHAPHRAAHLGQSDTLDADSGKLDRLGIHTRARANLHIREHKVTDGFLGPAQVAQQGRLAKIEYIGQIGRLRHKPLGKNLELGNLEVGCRKRFEAYLAHELGGDDQIDDRFLVLAFEGDCRPYRATVEIGFGPAVIDKNFVPLDKIVLKGKVRCRQLGSGIAGKKSDAIDGE